MEKLAQEFDQNNDILNAKYKVRHQRHPSNWPTLTCDDIPEFQSFELECKFPKILIIENAEIMTTNNYEVWVI